MSNAEQGDIAFNETQIDIAINALADRLAPQMTLGDWHVVSILLGAMPFTTAIMNALARRGINPVLDALWLSSYQDGQTSTGQIHIHAGLARPIKGKSVLVLDDIYDSGRTLAFARHHCLAHGADRVINCALLKNPATDAKHLDDFGLQAPDGFLIGFGLDNAGRDRGLPDIRVLPSV